MTYYAIYNPELGNCLVGLTDEVPEVNPPLLVKGRADPKPDLYRMEWNTSTLSFYNKPTRRLSKLEFIGRFGASYINVLQASKVSTDVEMFVKMIDWATPDSDGTSIDLDDPRVAYALNTLEVAQIIPTGTTEAILA